MFASLRPDMATGLDTALGEELDADYWPSTALFLVIDSAFATMAQGRVAAVLVHASALTARHNNARQAVGSTPGAAAARVWQIPSGGRRATRSATAAGKC
jgi:hypothetical protein